MATILLSAAGAAVGAGFGGSVLGLSGAVIGRAIGATLGRVIDQRLMGAGSQVVETGRVDRLRLTGASEGAPVGIVWGRMRVAGQVIWATRFKEEVATSGGGKGAPRPKSRSYSYSVSLAIGLCEGEIARIGRIWADGAEISARDLNLRVYRGGEDQLPDPKMEAVEGTGRVPAYRGIAYVVIEDLDLTPFGNRVPQFSFEVMRRAQGMATDAGPDLGRDIRGVALIPGTGEYSLATTAVHLDKGLGESVAINVNTPAGGTDISVSLEALQGELPACGSVSLVVSWFGDDLRCGQCEVRPKVEESAAEGDRMVWRAGGAGRAEAPEVARLAGRPVYGGTPADGAVIEAIKAIRAAGREVMFYPFILMDQLAGNGLADPWSGASDQPALPWRGRITSSVAAGRPGSPDGTAAAAGEVAAFFGHAAPSDFQVTGTAVGYTGPEEWSYRRFILHYAHLCVAAGGVDSFCIGSEMRGLTQIRSGPSEFPAVVALRQLAADVRSILGPAVKIGYAADWSEYRGFDAGGGDFHFHLDPLWADANVDFVGIDNYMPLSDWREGSGHADQAAGSVYALDYLEANVAGGEGFDWYYQSPEHREAQFRTPITDGAYGEPWVWRVKDVRSWWENPHHDRIGGLRQGQSAWVPMSKPVWFTEFGCPAIDKGANSPNLFLDPKSSESALPHASTGRRDDLMQQQYLRAMIGYWGRSENNPLSPLYGGTMVDLAHAHVWAWDARPFPWFPGNAALWSDGANYARGHWLNGRALGQPLSSVVAEICARAGVADVDVSGLYGIVRGYQLADTSSARAALQPLMLAYGFEASERAGRIVFQMRSGRAERSFGPDDLAVAEELGGSIETQRAPEAEMSGRVRLSFVEAEGDYSVRSSEAILPDERTAGVSQSELSLALTRSEGQQIVERWLSESRVSRDGVRFAVPPSRGSIEPGDVISVADGVYRIDRVERGGAVTVSAARVEDGVFRPSDEDEEVLPVRRIAAPAPVLPLFLDLPLMSGREEPHAPHLAVAAKPWPGVVSVYSSDSDEGYVPNAEIEAGAIVGRTLTGLPTARAGIWDRGPALRVRIGSGTLESASVERVLNGANLLAIGDATASNWELLQFARAELIAPNTYDLSLRLRGQAGTDATMPACWPAGSWIVRMDGRPRQITLSSGERGLARHYRVGPASRGYDDPVYVHRVEAFEGLGLRPLSPCHLRAVTASDGVRLCWTRRTRIDGDSWSGMDVPLGEASERYLARVRQGQSVVREAFVSAPLWTYGTAMRAADGVIAPFEVEVAQVSESFGAGPFTGVTIND